MKKMRNESNFKRKCIKKVTCVFAIILAFVLAIPFIADFAFKTAYSSGAADRPAQTIRVATFNMAHETEETTKVVNYIRDYDIDVIGFQEVRTEAAIKSIAETLGYYYHFEQTYGENGNAVIVNGASVEAPVTIDLEYENEPRKATQYKLEVDGIEFYFYNGHFDTMW